MSKRYNVVEVTGIAGRNSDTIAYGRREHRTELAASTVAARIRDMRRWASGTYDHVTDTGDSKVLRIVTASHYVTGVENVRILRIRPVAATSASDVAVTR